LGWFNPEIAHLYGFSENSSGVVYFNDGLNDWTQRAYLELPANFFGANGNANDMEVFDFDDDGFVDIVMASTTHEPYYNSRVIQFFKNNGGTSFSDVTSVLSPDFAKYADGNPYSNWWVGQGKLHILDYDHDGDLDIIDVNTRTSVFLNNDSKFTLYDDFVDADEDVLLWPVEIDGKYHYDFIGSKQDCGGDTCITNFYQLLDPPSSALLEDFFTKGDGFVGALLEASYLGDEIRLMLQRDNLVHRSNIASDLLGFSTGSNNFQITAGRISGKHLGNFFGVTYESSFLRGGVIINQSSTHAFNTTRWFGSNRAEMFYQSTETFVEMNVINSSNWMLTLGWLGNQTNVDSFQEEGGVGSIGYLASQLKYSANYANAIYQKDFFGIDSEIIIGSRWGKSIQPFLLKASNNFNFQSFSNISNDYAGINLYKGPYFLKLTSNSLFGEEALIGFQFNF